MKSEYINPFIEATQRAFSVMLDVQATPGNPFVFRNREDLLDVSGVIGLAGEARGLVILSFNEQSCLKIASRFAGVEAKQMSDVVVDAIGELVNIVAGNAKEGLLQYRIYISLPKVIGGDTGLQVPGKIPMVTVPFETGLGSFHLTVALKEDE